MVSANEKREWRCFHCDQVFTSEHCARLHFGADETHFPACQIKGSEGGLLRALREAEAKLMQANQEAHDEAGPVLMGWRDAQHRHHQALIAMEETGYERGVADMRAELEPKLAGALEAVKFLAAWQTTKEAMDSPAKWPITPEGRLEMLGERAAQRDEGILAAREFLARYPDSAA